MNEREKMLAGDWYDANYDEALLQERVVAQDLCFQYNQLSPKQQKAKEEILKQLLPFVPKNLTLLSPFACDYGSNIFLGEDVFVNINSYFMDGAPITIGNHVFIGPSCGFYTATHPLDYKSRNLGLEKALPIKIGDNCWFGANVSVMPGVTIGSGCVIAAGSVVTKDLPDHCMAAGVPAKVMKFINQE